MESVESKPPQNAKCVRKYGLAGGEMITICNDTGDWCYDIISCSIDVSWVWKKMLIV